MPQNEQIKNILTIDVEDWFHTSALELYISQDKWDQMETRLVPNVHFILDILNNYRTKATFFILGWVTERYPELIKEINACGHEIASHGYRHRLIYDLSTDTFRDYVLRSKHCLEDLIGKPILGYRATSFSVVKRTLWALDIIREAGFLYDSSIYPVRHDIYGIDGFPRFPFVHDNGLTEVPPSTWRIAAKNIPFGGGGYFRLYPYWITRAGIRKLNRAHRPAIVYLHPWELDPTCPRIREAALLTRFRQYVNLSKMKLRLERLLNDFQFGPMKDYLRDVGLLS